MFKQAIMAIAVMGALSVASPADAHSRDRGNTRIVVSYGTPVYYGSYYNGYNDPYYYRPRYRDRYGYYYQNDGYYRPRYRSWKKRHWKKRHHRYDRHHRHHRYDRYDRYDRYYRH